MRRKHSVTIYSSHVTISKTLTFNLQLLGLPCFSLQQARAKSAKKSLLVGSRWGKINIEMDSLRCCIYRST